MYTGVKNGDTIYLENNWKIVQRKVSGENRIELVGPSYEHYNLLTQKGVFTERIQYNTRYFVPADTNTVKIIDEILKISPVMRVENAKYSIAESEDFTYEQSRNDLLSGNSGRRNNESAGKQIRSLSENERRNRGKTEAERKKYAATVLEQGGTKEEIVKNVKVNTVNTEAYNEDMLSISEANKQKGINTHYFVGDAIKMFDGKRALKIDGFVIGNDVYLRYDGRVAPQMLNRHELVHFDYYTAEIQAAKEYILSSLTDEEIDKILASDRYKKYADVYGNKKELILEEFVADVLAGMNEYTYDFAELVNDYWTGDKQFIDKYKVSEYSNLIDTGDSNASVLENIGFGNEYSLSEGGSLNDGENSETLAGHGAYRDNDSIWQQSNDSQKIYRKLGTGEVLLRESKEDGRRFIDWSRELQRNSIYSPREKERAYGILREISKRRIADVDAEGRKLTSETTGYFSKTVFKNEQGELIPLYHATDDDFDTFEFGDFGFHVGNWEQAAYFNKKFIKEVYVNIENPMYIPNDSMHWPGLVIANRALSQGIITKSDYDSISNLDGLHGWNYNSAANITLRELLKEKGCDGIIYNNGFEGDGISAIAFDSNQIKYVSNTEPTTSPNIRYALDTYDNDSESLTPERKKEIFEQFEKDRAGMPKQTQKEIWGERAAWVAHNMTRVFPKIPERGEKGTFFAEFRKNMIQWKNLANTASFMVQDKLNKMTEGLTPEEFKTFSELVYFLDLQEEAQIQKDKGYTEILLPNEITPAEVDEIVKELENESTEAVKQALATLNPMYGFTSKDTAEKGEAFIASLSADDKAKLKIAQEYYENELMLPENVSDKLGKKGTSEIQAKNVLRNYINAKCK